MTPTGDGEQDPMGTLPLFDQRPYTPGRPAELAPENVMSPGRRRTLRNARMIDLGIHPVSGYPLADAMLELTCRGCVRAKCHRRGNHRWWKCELNATRGPGTDIRLKWPACVMYLPEEAP